MDAIIQYEIIIFRKWNQFGNHYRRAYKRLTNAQKTVKKIMQDDRQIDLVTIRKEEIYRDCGVSCSGLIERHWKDEATKAEHDKHNYFRDEKVTDTISSTEAM